MKTHSTYKAKIAESHGAFGDTVALYRSAVDFFIDVALCKWDEVSVLEKNQERQQLIERAAHATRKRPAVEFPGFDQEFYKFPSYLRRAAISEALGMVSSYKSNLANWKKAGSQGRSPSDPHAGFVCPALYKNGMFILTGGTHARIKVFKNGDWVWHDVQLRKSDMTYIERHCKNRKMESPVLRKRGKNWYLDFTFEEDVKLKEKKPVKEQIVVAVDLGENTPATCVVMKSSGTVIARRFCLLTRENDRLEHCLARIVGRQRHGSKRMPRLWALARGANKRLSVLTAQFIMEVALEFNADCIVFEHLDVRGKKTGKSKCQRLHHWRADYVQAVVTHKAHRNGIRISRVNAWGTSRLAHDGSGRVQRGKKAEPPLPSYSLCRFQTGKVFNCDLNAAYNIGARYFIREHLRPLPETARQAVQAKVPALSKRSTCTFADLISLYVELDGLSVPATLPQTVSQHQGVPQQQRGKTITKVSDFCLHGGSPRL